MGACQVEGITLAGQDIDWIQQVPVGRPRTGLIDRSQLPRVILRFNLQVIPFLFALEFEQDHS